MQPDTCQPRSSPSTPTCGRWWIAHLLVGLLLTANLAVFVLRNGVAVPYSDQWELHRAVWCNTPDWNLFLWQHGPHRQGICFPLTAAILRATHGDIRIECLWIAGWLVAAAALAWTLPRRLSGGWKAADALGIFWCLSLLQYETVVTTPNLSHSIGPLVLVLAAAHAFLFRQPWLRWPLAGLLGALLVFTGFGLFAGVLLAALAALTLLRNRDERRPAALALALLAAAWWRFFHDYYFTAAAPNFAFPHYPLLDYWPFLAGMLSVPHGFAGLSFAGMLAGGALLVSGILALAWAGRRLLFSREARPRDRLVVLLAGTALLFVANTAVGRVQLGAEAGMAPRYISLQIPLLIALYLIVRDLAGRRLRTAGTLALCALALWPYRDLFASSHTCGTWGLPRGTLVATEFSRENKLAWISIFKRTGDVAAATTFTRYTPLPNISERLPTRIGELRAIRWAPFTPSADIAGYEPFLPEPFTLAGFAPPGGLGRWLCTDGYVFADGRRGSWLNIELSQRHGDLPPDAPLQLEYAGRTRELRLAGTPLAFSLPLAPGPGQAVHLVSPRGGCRPPPSGAEHFPLSFLLGSISVTDTPRFEALAPAGDASWGLRAAIVGLSGFYGWEGRFGWMGDTLAISTETSTPATLDLAIGDRFPGLPAPYGLTLAIDDAPPTPLVLNQSGTTALFIPLAPGLHTVRLHSVSGTRSPLQCGYSDDSRQLSYRIAALTIRTPTP